MSALAIVGQEQRARDLMERLLRIASPLGLYAEEFDVKTAYTNEFLDRSIKMSK